MIKPVGDKFRLYSEHVDPKTGERRNLGTFGSEAEAKHHEQLVQAFKRGWRPSGSMVSDKRAKEAVSRAMDHPDVPGAGAAKRRRLRNAGEKVAADMGEFKRGTLRSGSGAHVQGRDQAIAIALHEAGLSRRR